MVGLVHIVTVARGSAQLIGDDAGEIARTVVHRLHAFEVVADEFRIVRRRAPEGAVAAPFRGVDVRPVDDVETQFVAQGVEPCGLRIVRADRVLSFGLQGFQLRERRLAVGGGVVTDLAGFVAGTFGRGIPFLNYATTLLAAADASIGGKTAVDTPLATNLIGLFNQPKKVYIDIASWKTLPKRQLVSGLAETIKHACMADIEFFAYLEDHMDDIFAFKPEVLEHVAEQNCRIKYEVVMKDELEKSLREILNLGHTVGRAIETVSGYQLLHGEALGIGLTAEVRLGNSYGYISAADVDRVVSLLKKAGLPTEIPDYIDREELIHKLYTDKKVRDGKLRFVFQKGIGAVMEFENGSYARMVAEEDARRIIEEM